ncbi:putative lipid-A-disaccharide synthase, mitochondrial [Dendrobium catenatum]|uniref:lipid-A-disaccharide synthase n=1 Tax=Dendrobium catenatum TaxID=906689 RepID=A0A2I0XAM0_9ASPA|nr:putative lipid-A-disaccharide synthase, mitochondrial [Dendrobium catenatum]
MRRASVRAVAVTASFWQRSAKARDLSTCSRRVLDMASRDGELRVFIVAGEVSGDSIASRLMASIKKISPYPVRFSGVGGSVRESMLFPCMLM